MSDVILKVARAIGDYGTSHFGTPYDEQDDMAKAMRRGEARAAIAALADNTENLPDAVCLMALNAIEHEEPTLDDVRKAIAAALRSLLQNE